MKKKTSKQIKIKHMHSNQKQKQKQTQQFREHLKNGDLVHCVRVYDKENGMWCEGVMSEYKNGMFKFVYLNKFNQHITVQLAENDTTFRGRKDTTECVFVE